MYSISFWYKKSYGTFVYWFFSAYLIDNGLSNSELGNCCVLNRVRNLRNLNLNDIKDSKEREKLRKAKEQVALKKNHKERKMTQEQMDSMNQFNEMLGL